MRGASALSSGAPGLCSGEEGLWPRLRSSGERGFVEGGGEVVGLVDRSKAHTLELRGELRESLRARTGELVRDGMERGGGEENLRHSRGDLSLGWSPLLLLRLF